MQLKKSKHFQILIPAIAGIIIGFIFTYYQPTYKVFRSQLYHGINEPSENQQIWFENRVFVLPNGLIARSYSGVDKTHLKDTTGFFSEAKVYVPENLKDTVGFRGFSVQALNSSTTILNYKKQTVVRDWLPLIAWSLVGFFIGLILSYFRALYLLLGLKKQKI